ncbi:MAG TPA: DUF4292 domain-containing protein [Flavobacteriaceae bacterium]|nr:DUF4292 domain-containing protein [Flavobacteriaceae bacterium]HEX5742822.1 DUF4292 domain-containing protein [Flavobacteriaceae bacterium]
MRIVFKVLIISLVLITTSCGSKKAIADHFIAKPLSVDKIVKNYHQNIFQKNTVKARIKVDYHDQKTAQSFIANLRMEKDKAIWITATVLGIPLVKALITPEKVSYYEKINETYFEGDFTVLSDWLGTELDFDKLQNLLLGQTISPIDNKNFEVSLDENAYMMKNHTIQQMISFLYWINPQHFRVNKQMVIHPYKEQYLSVVYKKYDVINNEYFPNTIVIEAVESQKLTKIELEFKTVEFNELLTFPFEIPNGYKPVQLN